MNDSINFYPTYLESIMVNFIPVSDIIIDCLSYRDISRLACVNKNFNILASSILRSASGFSALSKIAFYLKKCNKEEKIEFYRSLNPWNDLDLLNDL